MRGALSSRDFTSRRSEVGAWAKIAHLWANSRRSAGRLQKGGKGCRNRRREAGHEENGVMRIDRGSWSDTSAVAKDGKPRDLGRGL